MNWTTETRHKSIVESEMLVARATITEDIMGPAEYPCRWEVEIFDMSFGLMGRLVYSTGHRAESVKAAKKEVENAIVHYGAL